MKWGAICFQSVKMGSHLLFEMMGYLLSNAFFIFKICFVQDEINFVSWLKSLFLLSWVHKNDFFWIKMAFFIRKGNFQGFACSRNKLFSPGQNTLSKTKSKLGSHLLKWGIICFLQKTWGAICFLKWRVIWFLQKTGGNQNF